MTTPSHTLAVAALISVCAGPSLGASALDNRGDGHANAPVHVQAQDDALEDLERRADELSEAARRTIEEFIALVGPMLMRFSGLIEGLPTYEMPEILPNGDIIIRRSPASPTPADKGDGDMTET